ncbi:MAG: glucosyltransferase domain-containing protein [Glaciimonas sp.]|nr:glucosyltransferase domain-containing protein [Glaciimonas sp.]
MNNKIVTNSPDLTNVHFNEGKHFEIYFYFAIAAVIFLSYGYEIFNFNLTIDEEIHAGHSGQWIGWLAQGRWGMALLNYVLVQSPIVPVVSIFLGLAGLVIGIILLLRKTFEINQAGILSITALAITTPTLPFTFTFSTLAYGIGFAFLSLGVSNSLIYKRTLQSVVLACFLAAFAIGVYQTFVFALAMLAIVHAWRYRTETNGNLLSNLKFSAIYFFGSIAAYLIINIVAIKTASLDIKYIGQFIDINGFLDNPIHRTIASFRRIIEIFSLSPNLFGIRSIWLSASVFVSIIFCFIFPVLNRRYHTLLHTVPILIAVILVMVFADAIAQGGAPLRSLVYVPVGIAIVVAYAYTASGKVGRIILISLCWLAVIGNSQINNHLFASSASAEFRDKMLAETIINEIRKINPDLSAVIKTEVIGNHSWPVTGIQSKTETFGASFFEWDGGNRYRVSAYLNLNGLAAIGANEADRVRVYAQGKAMPVWPHAGWIAITNDVLILKFGDYSAPQKASLCAQGVTELCS